MEDCDRISTTVHTSGIFSSRSSYADLDASIFDDDVIPARMTTPLLARVPDEPWYIRLLSEWCDAWENVRNLWQSHPSHYAPTRMFFRGGLYIFGFFSIINSICLAIDNWSCQPANNKHFDNKSAATVYFQISGSIGHL